MNIQHLFRLFLWKNLRFILFNILSVCSIFAACLVVIGAYLRSTYNVSIIPKVEFDSKNEEFLKEYFPANEGDFLLFTPNTPQYDDLIEKVRQDLQLPAEFVKPQDNAFQMREFLEHKCRGNCFGVEFLAYPQNGGNLSYSISSTEIRVSAKKRYVNDEEVSGIMENDGYIRTGFFTLQHLIDKTYIESLSGGNENSYTLEIVSMPTIERDYLDSRRIIQFGTLYSILFSVLLLSTFIVPLVEEKQDGLKEFLIIATPLNFLNGVAFFLVRLVLYLVFFSIAFSLAWVYNALGLSSMIYVGLLYILYMLAAMSYAYLISVCFHSVFYAKIGSLILLIIPYVFYMAKGSLSAATYIFSTKTFLEGLETLQIFTNKHFVFESSQLMHNITQFNWSLGIIYIHLIIQCLVYCVLYNYLSQIFPGPGGIRKPYLFFLDYSFWKKQKCNEYTTSERGTDAIIIQDLDKSFKKSKKTICIADKLNMTIKNKQITVLLGHNGAGKTTTLNMIMGSEQLDGGKITVCCERDVFSYRHLIGFCPQHSVFMNYMTCEQHLTFFAELRGMSAADAKALAKSLLFQLNLTEKANQVGSNLSGGMRRRLSLGIALAGETKVVILDEPSSGLDIESRRELWNILLELRKTKAVLVTTHHMDEAEILGDTICILAKGRLQKQGSPLELKRKVGTGYILKLCLYSNGEQFKKQETLNLIEKYVPINKSSCNFISPTFLITLPYSHIEEYSNMLIDLESHTNEYGIQSISIADTTLEDVFLNYAKSEDQVDAAVTTMSPSKQLNRIPYQRLEKNIKVGNIQQFMALFYKKCIYLKSQWLYTLIMLAIPFLCVALAIGLMHSSTILVDDNELQLNLQTVQEGIVYVHNQDPDNYYLKQIQQILSQEIQHNGQQQMKFPSIFNKTTVEALNTKQNEHLGHFLQNVIGLIELQVDDNGSPIFKIFYSGNIYHSSVMLLNLIENVALKLKTSNFHNNIGTKYVPIQRFIADVSPSRLEYYAVLVPIGMFFCMFYYISLPFREYATGFKQLQTIPRFKYWGFTFAIDCLIHAIVCCLLFGFQYMIMPSELYTLNDQMNIVLSILFYGLSYLPILYSFANGLRSISTISTYLLFMLIISAVAPLITSVNLKAMQEYEVCILFLAVLPDFNLNHQLRVINENFGKTKEGLDLKPFFVRSFITWVFAGAFLIYILENMYRRQKLANILSYKCSKVSSDVSANSKEQDCLVHNPNQINNDNIDGNTNNEYPLVVSGLRKSYDRQISAVSDLNFSVGKQECFGLLGVNGAGKTSTFQMLSANITISHGDIKIDGNSIKKNEMEYKHSFGYCPQYDCLNGFMTSYEILKYMAMQRGIHQKEMENEIMYWLEQLQLEKYKNIKICHYSGGTKRKLNTAMAMIGSPSLVLLDEPTTGVDPKSRRALWKCIQDFQQRGKTVVLTSHSMDECEKLCNRLGIMACGKFKCIGHIPDLKQRYGIGFTIKIKLKIPYEQQNIISITENIQSLFEESELRENHAGMLTYLIKANDTIQWSNVFAQTQYLKSQNNNIIEDYSVNESTLEDIFLKVDCNEKIMPNVEDIV